MDEEQTVEVPRAALIRLLRRLDEPTKLTADYDAVVEAMYPDDMVLRFASRDDQQGQE